MIRKYCLETATDIRCFQKMQEKSQNKKLRTEDDSGGGAGVTAISLLPADDFSLFAGKNTSLALASAELSLAFVFLQVRL